MKRLIITLFIFFLGVSSALASHLRGGEITFKYIPEESSSTHQMIEFTIKVYRSCDIGAVVAPEFVTLSEYITGFQTTIPRSSFRSITPLCTVPDVAIPPTDPCATGNGPRNPTTGTQEAVFVRKISLLRNQEYYFYIEDCCRNAALSTGPTPTINGAAGAGFGFVAYINTNFQNSSPVYMTMAAQYFCANTPRIFNNGVIDSNDKDNAVITINNRLVQRDSLEFQAYAPWTNSMNVPQITQVPLVNGIYPPSIQYNPGFSFNQFLSTVTPITFNQPAGSGDYYINAQITGQESVTGMITREYRAVPIVPPLPNGKDYDRVVISTINREMTIIVGDRCAPITPEVIGTPGGALKTGDRSIQICGIKPGLVQFHVKGPNGQFLKAKLIKGLNDNIFYNPRYNITTTRLTTPSRDSINLLAEWDSAKGAGIDQIIYELYYCNAQGVKMTYQYTITIEYSPTIQTKSKLEYYCNSPKSDPVRLVVSGAIEGQGTYSWSPRTNIIRANGPDSSWIEVRPSSTLTYTARAKTGVNTDYCEFMDTTRVVVIQPFNYNIVPNVLSTCYGDTTRIRVSTNNVDTPFNYVWSNTTNNIIDPATLQVTNRVQSPIVFSDISTNLILTMTSRVGKQGSCKLTDTVKVTVNGAKSLPKATIFQETVCPGFMDTLWYSYLPAKTQISPYPPSTNRGDTSNVIVRSGTADNSYPNACLLANPASCLPNIYAIGTAGRSTATRVIYTKAQMTNSGVTSGIIKSLSYFIQNLNHNKVDTLTILMGKTNTNNVNTPAILTPVYTASNQDLVTGWNKHVFPRGFDWNGEDNIMVEFRVANRNLIAPSNVMLTSSVPSGNEVGYKIGVTTAVPAWEVSGNFTPGGISFSKPQTRFEVIKPSLNYYEPANLGYSVWSPGSFSQVTANNNTKVVRRVMQEDTAYRIVLGRSPQCSDTASVKVIVDVANGVANDIQGTTSDTALYCLTSGPVNFSVRATEKISGGGTLRWYELTWNTATSKFDTVEMVGNFNQKGVYIPISKAAPGKFKYLSKLSLSTCEYYDEVFVEILNSIPVTFKIDEAICNLNNGKLAFQSTSPLSAYEYSWNGGAFGNNASIENLAPNVTYSLTVRLKTNINCTNSSDVIVPRLILPLNVSVSNSPILCFGGMSDSVVARVNSPRSPGPYSYFWNGSASNGSYRLNNQLAGPYTVNVTDNVTGCVGTTTFNVTQPSDIVTTLTKTDVACFDGNSGSATANVIGGTTNSGYTYIWSSSNPLNTNFGSQQTVSNLYQSQMTLIVEDLNGCRDTSNITIGQPSAPLTLAMSAVTTGAINGNAGSATGVISGGTPNYTFNWRHREDVSGTVLTNNVANVINTNTYANLKRGVTTLEIYDANGCRIIDSIRVRDIICDIKLTRNQVNVSCFGQNSGVLNVGAIDALNNATTGSYTYTLRNSFNVVSATMTTSQSSPPAALSSFNNLFAGVYSVQVQTDKGCDTTFENIEILENSNINAFPTVSNVSCFGYTDGRVDFQTSGGVGPYVYNYGSGFVSDTFRAGYPSGRYNVIIRDALLCIDTIQITVFQPEPPTAGLRVDRGVKCFGDSNGRISIFPLPGDFSYGPYYFTNKSGTDQDSTSNVIDNVPAGIDLVTLKYRTTPTSSVYCEASFVYNLLQPTKLELRYQVDSVLCFGESNGKIDMSATLGATPPYMYRVENSSNVWSDPVGIYNNLPLGTYNLSVTDDSGCIATIQDIPVNQPDLFTIDINTTDASCEMVANGKIEVSSFIGGNGPSESGYLYNLDNLGWSNTNGFDNLRGLTTYNLKVQDRKACEAEVNVFVDTTYILMINQIAVADAKCFGENGKITVERTNYNFTPFTFEWKDAFENVMSSNANTLSIVAGTYYVTLTDVNGCTTTSKATVNQPDDIMLFARDYLPNCYGYSDGSIKVEAKGGVGPYRASSFQWNTNPIQFTDSAIGLTQGTYIVTVTDQNKCNKSLTVDLDQPGIFQAFVSDFKHISCFGSNDGMIAIETIGGEGALTYLWSNGYTGGKVQRNLPPNENYVIKVTDSKGCFAQTSQEIKEPTRILANQILVDSVQCFGASDGRIAIDVYGGTTTPTQPYMYSIDGGKVKSASSRFNNLKAGIYDVLVEDANSCFYNQKVAVMQPEELVVEALRSDSARIELGGSTKLSFKARTLNNLNYPILSTIWSDSRSLSCSECASTTATPYVNTTYTLEVRYLNNCLAKSNVLVEVNGPMDFFVPNAFSPGNRDDKNDVLYVYGNNIAKVKLQIFNRWGEMLFESDHQSLGWDGTYKGQEQTAGVYLYAAEVEYINGFKSNKKGSITLIR
jgi:gliding motility-associated-like protein